MLNYEKARARAGPNDVHVELEVFSLTRATGWLAGEHQARMIRHPRAPSAIWREPPAFIWRAIFRFKSDCDLTFTSYLWPLMEVMPFTYGVENGRNWPRAECVASHTGLGVYFNDLTTKNALIFHL